jgi:hypothetical protein
MLKARVWYEPRCPSYIFFRRSSVIACCLIAVCCDGARVAASLRLSSITSLSMAAILASSSGTFAFSRPTCPSMSGGGAAGAAGFALPKRRYMAAGGWDGRREGLARRKQR